MQQLYLLGLSSDHRAFVLSDRPGSAAATHVVPIDAALITALDLARRDGTGVPASTAAASPSSTSPSALTPREIQARLRRGQTVAEVAREAQAAEAWIERFTAPIVAERQAAIARAGGLTFHAPKRGKSALPLADAVGRNLLARGVRLDRPEVQAAWSAFQHMGRDWVVRFSYRARGRTFAAEWLVDLAAHRLVALDRLAGNLAYVGADPEADAGAAREAPDGPVTTPRRATRSAAATETSARTRVARVAEPPRRGPATSSGARPGVDSSGAGASARRRPSAGTPHPRGR